MVRIPLSCAKTSALSNLQFDSTRVSAFAMRYSNSELQIRYSQLPNCKFGRTGVTGSNPMDCIVFVGYSFLPSVAIRWIAYIHNSRKIK
jgi:hypothetical protein